MISKISELYEKIHIKTHIHFDKWANTGAIGMLKDKSLKPFQKILKEIVSNHNKLFYETLKKVDIEHAFGMLILLRINDYFQAIINCIAFNHHRSIYPLLRSLTETLFLLNYVDKHPEYIKIFMETEGRGVQLRDLKKEIDDEELTKYYGYLSNMIHSNPQAIKETFYLSKEGDAKLISPTPLNQIEIYEQILHSLIYLMYSCHLFIDKIFSQQWNTDTKILD